MKVKECMCDESFCVKPETKICEVAKIMSNNHVGSVVVCDNNNCLCGIVTDRDIILRSIACDKDVCKTKVTDVMTCNPCCCSPNTTIDEATKVMSNLQIRRMPVCDSNNKIVGILTLGDLAHHDKEIGAKEVCNTLENICGCDGNSKNAE